MKKTASQIRLAYGQATRRRNLSIEIPEGDKKQGRPHAILAQRCKEEQRDQVHGNSNFQKKTQLPQLLRTCFHSGISFRVKIFYCKLVLRSQWIADACGCVLADTLMKKSSPFFFIFIIRGHTSAAS